MIKILWDLFVVELRRARQRRKLQAELHAVSQLLRETEEEIERARKKGSLSN